MTAVIVGLTSLTFFWYFQSIASASDEMSSLEARVIPLFMLAALAVQGAMLVAASRLGARYIGSKLPVCLLAGALLALNMFSNLLGHLGLFLVQDDWVRVVVLAAAAAFGFAMASELHESRAMRLAVVAGGPLLLAGHFAFAALTGSSDAAAQRAPTRPELSPGMTTDAPTVRKVDFSRKPNVYMVSFDALGPDAVLERYLGVAPPLRYTEALLINGARLLPNAFADREPTRPSLNSLLALDVDYFDALSDSYKYAFFTGRRRSPAVEIFRHNGYRIQTMYRNNYLGRWQGPYVDFYGVGSTASACDHIEIRMAFLGYCTRQALWVMQRLIPGLARTGASRPQIELVLDRIRVAAKDDQRWLTLAYVFSPGHADQAYDHRRARDREAYRGLFARNQATAAAEIDQLFRTIRELDPGAVVLVFGDHGPLMSRGTNFADDPEFYVLDRHAIRMAIWPAEACRRELDAAAAGGFITVAMAVRAIVACLADGLDPVNKSVTYSLPYGSKDRYDRYLYEDASGAPAIAPRPAR